MVYNFIRAKRDSLDTDNNPDYPFFDHALRKWIGVYHTVTYNDPKVGEFREKTDVIRSKLIRVK